MRPMYCRGSTAASLTWRAKTCRADATLIVAAEDAAGALPPCGAAASDVFTLASLASQASKIFVTSAGDVVSLLTRSRTASAGFASWLRGAPMAPKYEAMSPLSPQYATRPSDRTNTLWKPANTSAEGWWIVHTTAALRLVAMESRREMIAAAAAESRPLVGSSRTITRGCFTSATARLSRRRWPPDRPLNRNPPARVSAQDVRPVTFRSSFTSTASWAASRSGLYILNANSR